MKTWAALLLLLAATATPAAAQQALSPEAAFTTSRTAEGCIMTAPPPPEATAALSIGMTADRQSLTRVTGISARFDPGTSYRIRLRARMERAPWRPEEQEQTVAAQGYRGASGEQGLRFDTTPLPILHGDLVDLYREGEHQPFATVQSLWRMNRNALNLCMADLIRADRGTGKPAVHPPVPRGPIDTFLINDDYPPAALRAEEQGMVTVAVTVSASGLVADCGIAGTSGSAMLDRTTCALLRRRARFHPALDADARPTQGIYRTSITWRIPGD